MNYRGNYNVGWERFNNTYTYRLFYFFYKKRLDTYTKNVVYYSIRKGEIMSKVFEYFNELEKLNGPTNEPTEEDMEPTDGELTEIEWELNNILD